MAERSPLYAALEQATIRVATAYAVANGYHRGDRRAVGLVLAGMAIMASCPTHVEAEFVTSYLDAFPPDARRTIEAWAEELTVAVGQEPV